MKKLFITTFFLSLAFFAFAQPALVKLWESDSVLKVPESVCYDKARSVLYVSNIDGTDPWAADGKGSIGKLSADGKVIAAEWVTGVNAPKGLGLYKNKLYVADLTQLVVINVETGNIEKRIPVPGAVGLNDVSVDRKGVVYVSDMKAKKLYRVINDQPEEMLAGLSNPNGLLKTKKELWLLDNGTVNRVDKDNKVVKVAEGLEGGTDGIEEVGKNSFIVSCWAGVVYHVNTKTGTKTVLLDGRPQKMNSADLGINAKEKIIYIPTFWRNTVAAYRIQ